MLEFRYFVLSAIVAVSFGCSGGSGATESASAKPTASAQLQEPAGRFIHTVLFWVKEGTSQARTQQLIDDCKTLLGPISSVRYLAAGPPAGTTREVVDNSYSVGLVVHFDDTAGHDVYQDAPKHLQFIERNQDIWERVQVYDMLAE
jgi:hypothetical protein